MGFGAAAKGMHKSAVVAGQSREQEGRPGEKSSRSEGEKDEFVGSEKRNSLGRRRRRRRLPPPVSVSSLPFSVLRPPPRPSLLPPSLALPCSPGPRSVRLYQMGIHPLSLPPCVNRERTAGRTSRATHHPPPCILMRGCVLEGTATT